MRLSVIIVNWNCKEYLEKCLNSIYKNKPKDSFEVVVVDNNSKDGSVDFIKKKKNKIKLIINKENVGFARACNQGIKLSEGQYILFLNPDTELMPNAIDKMIEYIEDNITIEAIAPRLLNADKTVQLSTHGFATLPHVFFEISYLFKLFPKNAFFKLLFGKLLSKFSRNLFENYVEYEDIEKVNFVSGACFLTRKKVIDKVGLFDENFFLYHEDMDWFYRFNKKGLTCIYFPYAEVIHYNKKCVEQTPERVFIERCKSLKYFFKKHHKNKVLIFKLIGLVSIPINIIISLIIYKGKNISKILSSRITALNKIIS